MDYSEVSRHNTPESCWVVLYGKVYDVTSFLPQHPGGSKVVLQLAGQDATAQYDPIHPPGTLEDSLPSGANLGAINQSTMPSSKDSTRQSASQPGSEADDPDQPVDLSTLLNLEDIEAAATKRISNQAWAYYYSASDDLHTKAHNTSVYTAILLRPRIFIDVTRCNLSTSFLSHKVDLPIFVSPAAMARLAHPSGEAGIASACRKFGACQIVSNNASMTPEDIVADAAPDQVFGWQLYVQTDRRKSEAMLARINKLSAFKFVVLTLDAPIPGKREHDERSKNVGANLPVRSAVQSANYSNESSSSGGGASSSSGGGLGKALFAGTAADLTWASTLPWLRSQTHLPIMLKGIQTHEDAYLASQHHPLISGIILSNHGGRALDTAPPAVHVLLEIRRYCPEVFDKIEVYVDGGVKRGTDVVKALALGARGVGVGRAALFALGAGGVEGVERMFEILRGEVDTAMRLVGVGGVGELGAVHVNTGMVEREVYRGVSGVEGESVRREKGKAEGWRKARL